MKKMKLNAKITRRYPDPLNMMEMDVPQNIEHYVLLCQACNLPDGLPTDPNPRVPKIDRLIYKDVKKSLVDESDPTFHLKNKGITMIAHAVKCEDKKNLEIFFDEGDGIVDGAHTYEIIKQSKEDCPDNQYIRIEILTGINSDMITSIAQGLNTAVQVQEMSLLNLDEEFNWIKEILSNEPYAEDIAYKENQNLAFDARDIVALMTLFNIDLFPDGSKHPKVAYTSKAQNLHLYKDNKDTYLKLKPLLKDILYLYDYVQQKSKIFYNSAYGGKGGGLSFFKSYKKPKKKPRRKYKLIFTDTETEYVLYDGALYPILGAFRYLVEQKDGENCFSWKVKSLREVKKLFEEVGGYLIYATKNTSDTHGKNPNAIGKDEGHWDNLYNKVGMAFLEKTMKSRN
ncbi:MAG: AIPR family protein [Planctomycetota bacterium]|jgi:hypothetical protein